MLETLLSQCRALNKNTFNSKCRISIIFRQMCHIIVVWCTLRYVRNIWLDRRIRFFRNIITWWRWAANAHLIIFDTTRCWGWLGTALSSGRRCFIRLNSRVTSLGRTPSSNLKWIAAPWIIMALLNKTTDAVLREMLRRWIVPYFLGWLNLIKKSQVARIKLV